MPYIHCEPPACELQLFILYAASKYMFRAKKVNLEFLQQNKIFNNFSVSCTQPHLSTFHQQMRQKDGAEPLQAPGSVKSLKDIGDRATP